MPCSTACRQAIVAKSFVHDAIQKTVSIVIGPRLFRPVLPEALAAICLPSLSMATKTIPATPVDLSPVTPSSDFCTASWAFSLTILNGRYSSEDYDWPSVDQSETQSVTREWTNSFLYNTVPIVSTTDGCLCTYRAGSLTCRDLSSLHLCPSSWTPHSFHTCQAISVQSRSLLCPGNALWVSLPIHGSACREPF